MSRRASTIAHAMLRTTLILLALAAFDPAFAAETSLTEQEVPSLHESDFYDIVSKENYIVMYYTTGTSAKDTGQEQRRMTLLQRGDAFMRKLLALKERTTASFKVYKVDWKNFPERSISRIRGDIASLDKRPESPSFVSYTRKGVIAFRIQGAPRPDTFTWFINEITDAHIPSIKTEKGKYLYAGWVTTDSNEKFANLADLRNETMNINGKTEKVRINTYRSQEDEGFFCTFEKIYLTNNKLIGSVETYGNYGKVGYFDYDNAGRMQYLIKYGQPAIDRQK